MRNTINMMKEITAEEFLTLDSEELIKEYKQDKNPQILAAMFLKKIKIIVATTRSYFGLSEEDIASFALEELDNALLSYQNENVKFSTYYIAVLKNRLRMETQKLNFDKRKANNQAISYNYLIENGYDRSTTDETEVFHLLEDNSFTTREKTFLKLLINNSISDVANLMNISVVTAYTIKDKIKLKIAL